MNNKELKKEFSFWYWLFTKGIIKTLNWWLLLHIAIGSLFALFTPISIIKVASIVVIPLVGVLIGLSFSWIGNAMALLETIEIKIMVKHHEGGIKEYIFSYQFSILILLTCIILWSLIGLRFDTLIIFNNMPLFMKILGKIFIFSITSFAIRECWQVVLSTQWLLLSKSKIREMLSGKNKGL